MEFEHSLVSYSLEPTSKETRRSRDAEQKIQPEANTGKGRTDGAVFGPTPNIHEVFRGAVRSVVLVRETSRTRWTGATELGQVHDGFAQLLALRVLSALGPRWRDARGRRTIKNLGRSSQDSL